MKITTLLTLGTLIGSFAVATAEDTAPPAQDKGKRGERPPTAEQLKKYDKDGDGKLSDDERKVLKEDRKKEMLAKYDTDKDGKLSDTEKAAAKADREAHKADKDKPASGAEGKPGDKPAGE